MFDDLDPRLSLFVMATAPAKKSAGDARCASQDPSTQRCPIKSRLKSVLGVRSSNVERNNKGYSHLSPCGHIAITDTPIIRTAAKSPANMNCRHLTEINSRYYGLSLLRTLTRGPEGVRNKAGELTVLPADDALWYLQIMLIIFLCQVNSMFEISGLATNLKL